ncbi:TRAP transporter substrate-binding protein [Elioraea tepida]|jgi:tripartite ATP-independent transporter DctP family solute receptor|uniref:TRAP transporter substrate-binding protein n=1 Tax=Elioraea tepida TaxID=2843330 RepID=A0A975YJF9_9PROT|nr:TRAP transporter substrate-binding protein [Elioraea tepida]QXM24760.1 TRAP transporter substrate-binding protein [Elioraea tepida]
MSRTGLVAVVAAAVFAIGSAPLSAQEWRGWNTHVPDYPNSRALDRWGELVAQRTNNRIRMRTFHSAQLGQQDEAIQQLRLGAIDFANFNLSPLNNLVPETQVLTLPFIFRDVTHLHKTVDGPVGDELAKLIEQRLNMVVLSWFDAGARSMYTRSRPIRTPADMQGLKIRVQTSDLWVDLIRALGANATPLPFGEVYTALQTGVIDGAENNWPSYESQRHFEVARFYSTTEHSNVPEIVVVAKGRWDRLSPADREILRTAAREASALQRQLWAEREKASRDKVVAAGVTVTEITDRAPWAALMAPLYEKYAGAPSMRALVDRIRAVQ